MIPAKVQARLSPLLISALRIVILSYLGLVAILFFFQSHFVYYPELAYVDTPENLGLPYDEVVFKSTDGVRLTGWFVPAGFARGTVLFCHGNAGNISHRLENIAILRQLGLNTFIFDYRGYGKSGGTPNEQGTYLDAEAAWAYLKQEKRLAPAEIILWGQSLGGPVAARLAQGRRPGALVLESAFSSFPEMAADLYPYLPARILSRYEYNTAGYLAEVRCPVLVIHSREDDLIPYAHGRRLYGAAKSPKSFLAITGTHNEGFAASGKTYTMGIERFLTKYFGD